MGSLLYNGSHFLIEVLTASKYFLRQLPINFKHKINRFLIFEEFKPLPDHVRKKMKIIFLRRFYEVSFQICQKLFRYLMKLYNVFESWPTHNIF